MNNDEVLLKRAKLLVKFMFLEVKFINNQRTICPTCQAPFDTIEAFKSHKRDCGRLRKKKT